MQSQHAEDNVRNAIEAALARAPVIAGRREMIPREAEIIHFIAMLSGFSNLPRARTSGGTVARGELKKLVGLSHKLGMHILGMHRDALGAIEREIGEAPPPLIMVDDLRKIIAAAERAYAALDESPAPRGRRGDRQAREVTIATAGAYRRLTGKEPAPGFNPYNERRSAFEMVLGGVFDALGISASAERQAKTFSRDKKAKTNALLSLIQG